MDKLNYNEHKTGRFLVRKSVHSFDRPYEIKIVEWSPSKEFVKLKYVSGAEVWESEMPLVIERLPKTVKGVVLTEFGYMSDEVWIGD